MSLQKYEFKSKVVEKKPCAIVMEIEVAAAQADKELEEAFKAIQATAKVAGFRTGKVPMDIVKKNYPDVAKERVVENVIKRTVFSAMEKENFAPIDMPSVTDINYETGKDLKYTFKAECRPDMKAKDYKGIAIKREKYKVTDANIQESIDTLLERNASLIVSESGIVTKNSFAIVDYEGFIDGKAVNEVKAKDFMIDLGAETTVKGFRVGLTGLKKGDVKDVEVEYPKDYPNKTLADKKVIFKTTIKEVKEKKLPELNDEFAKDMGLENLEDLKKKVRESLEYEEKRRQHTSEERQIVDALLEKNKFDVPESIVANQKQYLIKRMSDYMKSQGASDEFIAKQVESSDEQYTKEADSNVRLSYILNSIYVEEKLEVTEEELQADKQKMLDSNPDRKDDVEKYFKENKENISAAIKEEKIFNFIVSNAKISESEKDMPLSKKK